jgi:hypothetical protein
VLITVGVIAAIIVATSTFAIVIAAACPWFGARCTVAAGCLVAFGWAGSCAVGEHCGLGLIHLMSALFY